MLSANSSSASQSWAAGYNTALTLPITFPSCFRGGVLQTWHMLSKNRESLSRWCKNGVNTLQTSKESHCMWTCFGHVSLNWVVDVTCAWCKDKLLNSSLKVVPAHLKYVPSYWHHYHTLVHRYFQIFTCATLLKTSWNDYILLLEHLTVHHQLHIYLPLTFAPGDRLG